MGGHATWFDLFPAVADLAQGLEPHFGRAWTWQVFQSTYFEVSHALFAILVVLLLAAASFRYRAALRRTGDAGLLPSPRLDLRGIIEGLCDMVFNLCEGVLGERAARKHLPLLGSLFFFILFSNLISLLPGFRSPTNTLKTNLALSSIVFLLTHYYGVRAHGVAYLRTFTGHLPLKPLWTPIVLLMILIEVISHLIRPASLALRLMANMFADHTILMVFFGLVPLVVPIPFLVLGIFVSVVQAVVFTLLSASYIGMAIAHEEH